jgi:transcriptional regulator with GAF, ATPase, and Fis domain
VVGRRYLLCQQLGSGSQGSVWLAEDLLSSRRQVALKTWRLGSPHQEVSPATVGQEFRLLTRIRHAHVARVFDWGVAEEPRTGTPTFFFTREFVQGVDLVSAFADPSPAQALELGATLCHALGSIHDHGVVHGDLSPANVLAPPGQLGELRLIDFGLASLFASPDTSLSWRKEIEGTLSYLAPERLQGSPASPRSDLYALGALLFHLLAGRPPFEGSVGELIRQHLEAPPPPLTDCRPDAPSKLVGTVQRLLAKDPAHRYASAWDVLRDLEGTRGRVVQPLPEAPLVGREAEVEALATRVRPHEPCRVVALIGDSGLGRTRLLEALRWQLELSGGLDVVELAFGELVDPLETAVARLATKLTLLRGQWPPPAEWLDAAKGRLPEYPGNLWPQLAQELSQAVAQTPTVVVVDDLHLAPEGVHELLRCLAQALEECPAAPPLVVAGPVHPRIDEFLAEVERVERVHLSELGPEETRQLVVSLAGPQGVQLADRLRRHVGGYPGHLVEMVRAVVESGHDLTAEELPVPRGVAAAVGERFDRLAPSAQQLLAAVAVVERPVHPAVVADLQPELDVAVVQAHADELVALGWLEERDGSYSLTRPLVRQAIYEALSPDRRQSLHRRLAVRLSAQLRDAGEAQAGDSLVHAAWHVVRAGGLPNGDPSAGSLVLDAAQHLTANRAPQSASQLLQEGLALTPRPQQWPLVRALAESWSTIGKYQEALELLMQAAREPDWTVQAEALSLAGGVLERQGRYDEAAELVQQALDQYLEPEAQAAAYEALARVHLARGAAAAALDSAQQGLDVARAPIGRARLLALAGTALGTAERHDEANDLLEESLLWAERADDDHTLGFVAGHRAVAHARCGRHRDALAAYQEAVERARACGDRGGLPVHLLNLGTAHHVLGELGAALDLYLQAATSARLLGKKNVVVAALTNLADLYAQLGAAAQGQEAAQRASVWARRLGMVAFEARALQARAECVGHESAAAGLDDTRRAAELYQELKMPERAAEASLLQAELLSWVGDHGAAQQLARTVWQSARDHDWPLLAGRATLVRAEIQLAQGELAGVLPLLDGLVREPPPDLSPELMWRAHTALGQLSVYQGDTAAARRWLVSAWELREEALANIPPEHREAYGRKPSSVALALLHQQHCREVPGEEKLFRLLEVNRAVLAEEDPRRRLELALDTAIELCGAERGFLLLLGPEGSVRVDVARNLDREAIRSARLQVSRSIAEHVARAGEPLLTSDAQEDDRFALQGSVQALRLRSVICVPIRGRHAVLGTLYLDNRFETGRFRRHHLRLLLAFADVVAIALENARLLEENTRRAQELKAAKEQLEAARDQQDRHLASVLQELETTREVLRFKYDYSHIIGQSAAMRRVFALLDRVTDTVMPVLIHGESGTGKELIATALHCNGPRKKGPFISVNCAALPETLLESELFGHVRGAFTGAMTDKPGLIPAAHRGTLFLDEIGDMPLAMQAKLLRILQEGQFRPVGATETQSVDLRVVAASHRDLADEVAGGRFREDLYYRINVIRIDIPPLRGRREDIPLLVDHILARAATELGGERKHLTPAALERLLRHDWPGNIRELENLLRSAAVMTDGAEIDAAHLPLTERAGECDDQLGDVLNLAELERRAIGQALRTTQGNKKKAAELLGIARLTLYRKLKSFDDKT